MPDLSGQSARLPLLSQSFSDHHLVTPTEISNTENHKNYHMTEVMCPMGSFKYNYGPMACRPWVFA